MTYGFLRTPAAELQGILFDEKKQGGKAMKIAYKIYLLAFFAAGILALAIGAYAGDVEVQLPSTNGSDAFQVQDSGSKVLMEVQSNGRVGIGTTDPHRQLHVRGTLPGIFENTATYDHAVLDLDSPNIFDGNFARLSWRSDDSASNSEQFAAIDVIYDDKTDGSEDAEMHFVTMQDGTRVTHMIIDENGNVGIGFDPTMRLHVKDSAYDIGIINFENTYDSAHADLLNLKINTDKPGSDNNFITFYEDSTICGAIEGDGSGGVSYQSGFADFAERLPRVYGDEVMEAGDIVGVVGGRITKRTLDVDNILAISTSPIVLGNAPGKEKEHLYEKVAFLGQVPVKVRGAVKAGDCIIPSGMNDGIGIAVSPEELRPAQVIHMVGRAWESSQEKGIKLINTAVGMPQNHKILYAALKARDSRIADLELRLSVLEAGSSGPVKAGIFPGGIWLLSALLGLFWLNRRGITQRH
jgi:hypothetical protein